MTQKRKIRVLETIRQGKIGGGESHVLDLVATLNKEEFEPVVLSFTDGPMITALEAMNIPVTVIQSEKPFDLRVWKAVKRFIAAENIDIVHVHGTRANTNVLWAARSLGLPIVYTVHGWSFHEGLHPISRRLRIAAEKFITRKANINICVSAANQHTGTLALGKFNSIVIRNGINLQKFNADASYPDLRAYFNIPANKVVVCFIARMTYQKDPITMVKAFAKASLAAPQLHLIMVGDGELKEEAMKEAVSNGVQDKITFAGFRQDVPALLNAADIYCLPSLWEGFPIGVLEAMAMGKAVVASDVDGTKEAVSHNENGVLVQAQNISSIAAALVALATDQSRRNSLQQEARKTVLQRFNVTKMTNEVEKVYHQLHKH
ncbi:glycosyltransferase family 1 protein [Chitinophaga silvatica]|uniref:Glycosyltransferase family 1 protein n=1 Tax=Chitinophaga silvatica TaxID=2282649 RepID=A0A3E1Y4F1_9BACT|nr:glycosyltransferase family 4 protein [Chitinophaga silvatica]RFS19568.1 glycosyltransferase family 1 protein [Chitinophaga silvatica]